MQGSRLPTGLDYGPLNPYALRGGFADSVWREMKLAVRRVCGEPPFTWANFFDVENAQRFAGLLLGDRQLMAKLYEAGEAIAQVEAARDRHDEFRAQLVAALAPVLPMLNGGTARVDLATVKRLCTALEAVAAAMDEDLRVGRRPAGHLAEAA